MATLSALKFDTVDGAGNALTTLESLSKQQLIEVEDAAIVYWEVGKSKPKTHQMHSMTGADVGIDDDFIKSLQDQVTEGTSALFLLTREATEDKVVGAMKQYDFEIISTSLSQEDEDKLRAAFAGEE
jgi:uncharacterized membrane protein